MAKSGKSKWLWIGAVISLIYLLTSRGSSKNGPGKNPTLSGSVSNPATASQAKTSIPGLYEYGYSERMADNWFDIAKMETAGFTSPLYREYRNPWGMKQPSKRATTSKGGVRLSDTGSTWASYASVPAAIEDLVLYMREFNYPKDFPTLYDQVAFMKQKGYFEEPLEKYYNLVTSWKSKSV